MKLSKIFLMTFLSIYSINTLSWGFQSSATNASKAKATIAKTAPVKDIKKIARVTGKGLSNAAKHIATINDRLMPFYVYYSPAPDYNLGIKSLAIELAYPSGKSINIPIITDGITEKIGRTSKLFKDASTGGSSSITSDILSDNSSWQSSRLYFRFNYRNKTLVIDTMEEITTTSQGNSYSSAHFNSNNYQNESNYQSESNSRTVGSSSINLGKLYATVPTGTPKTYKVIINGRSTSAVPLFRKFYINITNNNSSIL